jgi:succinate-semialdehyde dehydrogenase/glutarate-semialdehyde dehydrogenase
MALFEEIPSESDRRRFRIKSPVSLESIGEFEAATAEDVKAAVERARVAQREWATRSFAERAKILWRWVEVIAESQDELVELVLKETGKARNEAIMMEVMAPCMQIAHYAKYGAKYLRTKKRRPTGVMRFSKKLSLVYQPLGVVGLITPWNGPIALVANPLAQAFMAGNAVVHKPSEVTPFSAMRLKALAEAAGFPPDLYQVVQGDGETGAALIDSGVDKVSFTGSVATGRKVGEACGRNLIPVTLELGGKDAMIVCADADLDRAVEGAIRGSFFNSGHYCCGTERVYVPDSIYPAFVEKVVTKTKALTQTAACDGDVGAIFWDKQMDIIEAQLADATAKGAKVLVGGKRNRALPGYFFPPTVVVDVGPEMDLMRQETFGPVLAIQRVRDEQMAISLANDSKYGLSGNLWTRDLARGETLAEQMVTGSVCVNDISVTYGIPEAPFGGRKASGLGQVNGEIGIRGYCHLHPIIIETGGRSQGGYPYTPEAALSLQKLIRRVFGNRLLRWFFV